MNSNHPKITFPESDGTEKVLEMLEGQIKAMRSMSYSSRSKQWT